MVTHIDTNIHGINGGVGDYDRVGERVRPSDMRNVKLRRGDDDVTTNYGAAAVFTICR